MQCRIDVCRVRGIYSFCVFLHVCLHFASYLGPPGCNLFVFHIPNDMTNQDLFNYFGPYGNVISARIMVEKETGRSRGFGTLGKVRALVLATVSQTDHDPNRQVS
jgi:hypothetical protein